ncbi:unnamed protein product [Laminaria digitata]
MCLEEASVFVCPRWHVKATLNALGALVVGLVWVVDILKNDVEFDVSYLHARPQDCGALLFYFLFWRCCLLTCRFCRRVGAWSKATDSCVGVHQCSCHSLFFTSEPCWHHESLHDLCAGWYLAAAVLLQLRQQITIRRNMTFRQHV